MAGKKAEKRREKDEKSGGKSVLQLKNWKNNEENTENVDKQILESFLSQIVLQFIKGQLHPHCDLKAFHITCIL